MSFAVSVFDEIEIFEDAMSSGEEAAEITLSANDSILRYLLPEAVEVFHRTHPLGRLRLLARPVEGDDPARPSQRVRSRRDPRVDAAEGATLRSRRYPPRMPAHAEGPSARATGQNRHTLTTKRGDGDALPTRGRG